MSNFSLNPDMTIEVFIRFINKGSESPLSGPEYAVKLFDKDIIGTDHLGESGLDANGVARIRFSHASFGEWNKLEQYPDIFFELYKDGDKIFKSELMNDLDIEKIEQFRMGTGEQVDLGTYLVQG
ncbi:MAG: hypothetical protein WCH29_09225 [Chitinophagaceae bacterium]